LPRKTASIAGFLLSGALSLFLIHIMWSVARPGPAQVDEALLDRIRATPLPVTLHSLTTALLVGVIMGAAALMPAFIAFTGRPRPRVGTLLVSKHPVKGARGELHLRSWELTFARTTVPSVASGTYRTDGPHPSLH
jgi:hypothetical protein